MPSEVSLCNIALLRVGARAKLQSLAEASEEAAACALVLPLARDSSLERHDWSFARRRAALAPLDGDAPQGWAYRYALPADCLSPRRLVPEHPAAPPPRYALEDGALLADAPAATLVYTARLTDPNGFPPAFADAVAWAIAAELAVSLMGKADLRSQCLGAWQQQLASAATLDANRDAPPRRDPDPPWIAVRDGGRPPEPWGR